MQEVLPEKKITMDTLMDIKIKILDQVEDAEEEGDVVV